MDHVPVFLSPHDGLRQREYFFVPATAVPSFDCDDGFTAEVRPKIRAPILVTFGGPLPSCLCIFL